MNTYDIYLALDDTRQSLVHMSAWVSALLLAVVFRHELEPFPKPLLVFFMIISFTFVVAVILTTMLAQLVLLYLRFKYGFKGREEVNYESAEA